MDEGKQEIIKTTLGPVWITRFANGYMRIWWPYPYQLRVSELAMSVLDGVARWHPETKGWYVSPKRKKEIYSLLCEL